MEKQILVNQIRTPDGTVLVSRHRHDYVTYTDKNGKEYMVDGGNDYLRRNVHTDAPHEEISVYSDEDFEKIREHFCRGGRGKDGKEALTWVPLQKMSNAWVLACIDFNADRGMADSVSSKLYNTEIVYRAEKGIFIED